MPHAFVSKPFAWERRASERLLFQAWCFVETDERTYVALTNDLSLGGLGLNGVTGLQVGDFITVHLMLPDGGELRGRAEVRNALGKHAGLRWVRSSPKLSALYQSLSEDECTGIRRIVR